MPHPLMIKCAANVILVAINLLCVSLRKPKNLLRVKLTYANQCNVSNNVRIYEAPFDAQGKVKVILSAIILAKGYADIFYV